MTMRVLIYSKSPMDREAVSACLVAANHSLDIAESIESASQWLARVSYDVVLIEWSLHHPPTSLAARAMACNPRPQVIAIPDESNADTLRSAFQAKVDDVQRRPIVGCELEYRINGRRFSSVAPAPRPQESSCFEQLLTAPLMEELTRDLRGLTSDDLRPVRRMVRQQYDHCIEIGLSNQDTGSSVRLLLGIDRPRRGQSEGDGAEMLTRPAFARALGIRVSHALQRAAELAGWVLVVSATKERAGSMGRAQVTPCTFAFDTDSGLAIDAVLEVPHQRLKNVTAPMLRGGMIAAKDISTSAGRLLVAEGSRITDAVAERLNRMLPAQTVVAVFVESEPVLSEAA